jgi:hypothetical protein
VVPLVSAYTCSACSTRVKITYEEKLRLLSQDVEDNVNPKPQPSPDLPSDLSIRPSSNAGGSKH